MQRHVLASMVRNLLKPVLPKDRRTSGNALLITRRGLHIMHVRLDNVLSWCKRCAFLRTHIIFLSCIAVQISLFSIILYVIFCMQKWLLRVTDWYILLDLKKYTTNLRDCAASLFCIRKLFVWFREKGSEVSSHCSVARSILMKSLSKSWQSSKQNVA